MNKISKRVSVLGKVVISNLFALVNDNSSKINFEKAVEEIAKLVERKIDNEKVKNCAYFLSNHNDDKHVLASTIRRALNTKEVKEKGLSIVKKSTDEYKYTIILEKEKLNSYKGIYNTLYKLTNLIIRETIISVFLSESELKDEFIRSLDKRINKFYLENKEEIEKIFNKIVK